MPQALRAGTIHVTPQGAGAVELTAYSAYHPVTVPAALMDVLHVFDGRPTRKAMTAAAEAGVAIERDVVARLVDMGVLVDADAGP